MKKLITMFLLLAGIANSQQPNIVPDEYIVILNDGTPEELAKGHGVEMKRRFARRGNAYGFHAKITNARKLDRLRNDPKVDWVEPEQILKIQAQTIPPGIRRIGTNSLAKIDGVDQRVNADIAIIDTGIQLDHPDLNVVGNVSFTGEPVGPGDNPHGTHVAGIAAAIDNSIGVVGVAPGARLWAVKVLGPTGSGSLSAIIAGVDWVTDNANTIEVANMSLGGQGTSDALRSAIQRSVEAGVVFVVAAGNSSTEIYGGDDVFGTWDDFFPASYPEVMTISAMADTDGMAGGQGLATTSGADDTQATFSNYSKVVVANNPVTSPGAAIDVAAPGVDILSTYTGSAYATMSGTSMASPHAAGAVALYCASVGRATNAASVYAIRQTIINLAQPQTLWGTNAVNPNPFKDHNPEPLLLVNNFGGSGTNLPPVTPPVITNPPPVMLLPLTAKVATDYPSYTTKQFVTVAVSAMSSTNQVGQANTTVKVLYPSGKSDTFTGLTSVYGMFYQRWKLNQQKTSVGTATVTVTFTKSGYSNAVASTTFRIGR